MSVWFFFDNLEKVIEMVVIEYFLLWLNDGGVMLVVDTELQQRNSWVIVMMMLLSLLLLTEVSGVFALSTSSAAEINSLLTDMSSGNDRLSDLHDNTGQ